GGSLSWILCPVIKLAQDAANQVDDFITNALNIDVSDIFANNETSGTPQNAYYTAWNSFRIISLALLVIGGLVMVISQALGYEIFDAYTVRRVLPRLLVAVMGIALAWPMLKYFIKFFDVVGFDIRNLIYAPFVPIAQSGHISIGTSLFTWGAVIAGGIFVGFAGLTYILTALLAIFVGFLILVIRRVAIIMLVILSPIAIASYILPNTQRIWKLWRDNFLGLMVMFPIISAFIAAGHVFAAVSLSHTGGAGASTVQQMIGIAAYFVPYFLLPVTFRMASGAIGNIAGFVNDRHRGAFDRLKGVRGNATQRNMQRMRDGERFNNAALNNLTARATTSRFGFGAQGQAAYQQKLEAAAARHAKSEHGMVSQFNDNLLRSQTFANEAEARQGLAEEFGLNEAEINQAIADTKANGGWGQARAVHAAKQLARTGTGYKTLDQATRTAARVAGGNESMLDDLSGSIYYESKGAGRWDLTAGGAGDFSKLAAAEAQSLAGSGTGPSVADYHAATVKASKGADAVTILRGKPQEVETLTQSLGDHARALHLRSQDTTLSAAQRQAATDEFIDTMGQIEQLKQSKSYASQTNQEHVNTLLNDTEDLRTGVLTELLGNDTATVDPTTGRVRFGRSNTDPSLTQAQVDNRNRYEQASAPRQNPNDPNMP
ncbi:MAG TPA: hypothetical protein VG992_01960, partial [Candidatus Saccharimonadales bacterium]|nr:hypothetical protein [Candidatus Saccharimonadales bacterium]